MKQTKNHKLNLVEMSDTFSTEPLNQNMETIDAALKSVSDTASSISKRVLTLEGRHIACGTYSGDGATGQSISVGFTPKGVAIGGTSTTVIVGNVGDINGVYGRLETGGFRVSGGFNTKSRSYNYIAFD